MPEIIECEKMVHDINKLWVGNKITEFETCSKIDKERFFDTPQDYENFQKYILGQKAVQVQRWAKHIQVQFESRWSWWFHFSSTGWFKQTNFADGLAQQHYNFLHSIEPSTYRISMKLDDGQEWFYCDSRAFGKFYVKKGTGRLDHVRKYGPDWLQDPEGAEMSLQTHRGNRIIKVVLCDQQVAAGVGNYMACEACFLAKVNPLSRWSTLEPEQIHKLGEAIRYVMHQAQIHEDHSYWNVFKREGKLCVNASALDSSIHTIKYKKDPGGQRGSYYCPICQGESTTFNLRKSAGAVPDGY